MKIGIRRYGRCPFTLAIVVAMLGLAFVPAAFGAQRTFVLSTGVDTNPCSIAAPCRSFATALTHTDPAGEIIVLDSAGYGPVTVAQSVSITAPPGIYAGISVFPTFDGVSVNGAGIIVALKGLSINGLGGNHGIRFLQGARLSIEGCTVSGMAGHGVSASAVNGAISIADSIMRGNTQRGINVVGALQGSIVRSRVEANGADGIFVADGAVVSVADAVAVDNTGIGVHAQSSVAATTKLVVDRLEARGNTAGVVGNATAASGITIVHVTRSKLSQNTVSGMQACCSSSAGTVIASVTDTLVANSGSSGIVLSGANTAWVLTVGGNRIVDTNGIGLVNSGSAGTLKTRQDNMLPAADTFGTLTPISGF